MYLILFIIGFLALNCLVLFLFQEKSIVEDDAHNAIVFFNCRAIFKGQHKIRNYIMPFNKEMSFKEKRKFIESKRQQDLNLERIQLENKLRMLNYISDFELYLAQNKIDKNKFNKMRAFLDLKVSTQKSILESTARISGLSVMNQ